MSTSSFRHIVKFKNYGFTFIEVTIATAIASTLIGVVIINLLNIHQTKTVQSTSGVLISDLRTQQTKAMSLSAQNTGVTDDYGVYFGTTSYFLFKGSAYDPNNPVNSEISLPENFSLTAITLPDNQIVFLKGSGEVLNFIDGQNSLTIHNTDENSSKTLKINRYGVVNYN